MADIITTHAQRINGKPLQVCAAFSNTLKDASATQVNQMCSCTFRVFRKVSCYVQQRLQRFDSEGFELPALNIRFQLDGERLG